MSEDQEKWPCDNPLCPNVVTEFGNHCNDCKSALDEEKFCNTDGCENVQLSSSRYYCDDCRDSRILNTMRKLWRWRAKGYEKKDVKKKLEKDDKIAAIGVARKFWQLSLRQARLLVEWVNNK